MGWLELERKKDLERKEGFRSPYHGAALDGQLTLFFPLITSGGKEIDR